MMKTFHFEARARLSKMSGRLSFMLVCSLLLSAGCSSHIFEKLNPYDESQSQTQELGDRSTKTLLEDSGAGGQAQQARHALEVMGSYRRAQDPQPYYPVIQPAEVRLMWIPDHLTKTGDLVPSHYYYLKVLHDRWEVQDAFDFQDQLEQGSSGAGSSTPWITKGNN